MAILDILQYPNPRLNTKAYRVTDFNDASLQKIIDDMCDTYFNAENCAALAATQLDIQNPPHVTVIEISQDKENMLSPIDTETVNKNGLKVLCLVNGEIVQSEGDMIDGEACMSIAGVFEKLKRAAKVWVRGQDRQGKVIEFTAQGFMAKCLQHEDWIT